MTTRTQSPARARPLEEVKSETIRRAGKLNPLDGINAEDGVTVANALKSLDRDEWAGEWSKLGTKAEAVHPLKGNRKGTWAVRVSGNWRVTFNFIGKDATAVDYEDYH